jgi:hypothetical protein
VIAVEFLTGGSRDYLHVVIVWFDGLAVATERESIDRRRGG